MATKRPTIAERTLLEQVKRVNDDIAQLEKEMDLIREVAAALIRQRNSLLQAIQVERERNAKP